MIVYMVLYGILFSLLSFGFFFYDLSTTTVYTSKKKKVFKLIFTTSTGWIVLLCIIGAAQDIGEVISLGWLLWIIVFIMPVLFFIGFLMQVYGMFKTVEEN